MPHYPPRLRFPPTRFSFANECRLDYSYCAFVLHRLGDATTHAGHISWRLHTDSWLLVHILPSYPPHVTGLGRHSRRYSKVKSPCKCQITLSRHYCFRTSKAPTPPRRVAFNSCKQHSHPLGQISANLAFFKGEPAFEKRI